jgi:hypothetical protein
VVLWDKIKEIFYRGLTMTLTRPMIRYLYEDTNKNNIEEVIKFAKYFNQDCDLEFDDEYCTLIVVGSDNVFPQRLFNGDYLIFDEVDVERTFSIGTTSDAWGWGYSEHNNN